ncbi:amidohydrolase family protein [Streptomyces sulphureus]|uniref:amidohydrolase family protein n=1 Tax=Streptomyces sulphureus TaxID=47758 RepID=UPI000378E9E1|nr:amidohydrolase family protein [Streptomyces sulphureus]
MALILRGVELDGRRTDVRVDPEPRGRGTISAVGAVRPRRGDRVVHADGGALLPGLVDRHLHLMGLAAAADSVECGPPSVTTTEVLAAVLRRRARNLPEGGWLRGVGYHESVAGDLDRDRLDALAPGVPVRVQHRTGAMWCLSGTAIARLGLDTCEGLPEGAERDADGRFTGRLWRQDAWLRRRLGPADEPDLAAVGSRLAAYGVTAVTDATPELDSETVHALARAADDGRLPQRLTLLGVGVTEPLPSPRLGRGPFKLLPPDHDPWSYEEFRARVHAARGAARRPVAVHCVTRESLVLTLAVLRDAGLVPGDRIEHAAVVPPELRGELRELGLLVVTQPAFVAERGDRYLSDVEPDDLPHLYPYASLTEAGVAVVASSDAPYGTPDPWAVIRAARDRRTPSGEVLGPGERVTAAQVLTGMLARGVVVRGAPGDLCLLRTGLHEALGAPAASLVRLTVSAGRVVHDTGAA